MGGRRVAQKHVNVPVRCLMFRDEAAQRGCGAVFRRQIATLSAEYRVVTVDLRGFGQSDKPETGYTEDVSDDDLHCILNSP